MDAVRDGSQILVMAHPELIEPLISRLDDRSAVFRRIALHVLRLEAPAASDLVTRRLLDSELLYGIDCYHEYWLILHDRFHDLTVDERAALFELIALGPTFYREGEFSEAERTLRIEVWQWRVLAAIKDQLPPEWAERYRILTAERGEPEHPDLLSYTSTGWVGPTSPTSPDQLSSMTTDEIVEYLRTWTPTREWHSPTPEGLGRDLSAAVKSFPDRFSTEAAAFRALNPTYVRSLFWGLREAVAERCAISWTPVLELANWVLQQPRDLPGREDRIGDVDPGWSWTRRSIADLVGLGMKDGPSEVPFELRTSVWSVLQALSEDEDPTPESEERFGGSNMDPATLAINSVRGEAIGSVIGYALWVYRHLESGKSGTAPSGFAAMPEVSIVLSRHLDVEIDPSLAIRSLYGSRFPWLLLIDNEWTRERVSQIFPTETHLRSYWDAAWDAYIAFCPPFNEPFDVLQEEYRRAVDRLPEGVDPQRRPHGVPGRLADHLMTMYRRARLDLEPGGLLDAFYLNADDELRAWAMASVGRSLQVLDSSGGIPTPVPIEPSDSSRLMKLWTTRLETARAAVDRTKYRKELSEFGWWFTSRAFEVEWSLQQLLAVLRLTGRVEASHLVLRQLSTTALSYPTLTLDALRLMIQGDTEGWTVVVWDKEVADILRVGIGSPEAAARRATIDVIHQLGARGLRQYRELLPSDSASQNRVTE